MSIQASVWGMGVGSMAPMCSLELMREDRMPDSAFVSSRKGGHQDEQCRQGEERAQPEVHHRAREQVDEPGDEQDGHRLMHDAADRRQVLPPAVHRTDEAGDGSDGGDVGRQGAEVLDHECRQPERREGGDVTDRRHQWRRDGVEVPAPLVGPPRDHDGGRADDGGAQDATEDRDRDEVCGRHRLSREGDGDDVGRGPEEQTRGEGEVPGAAHVLAEEPALLQRRLELPGVDPGAQPGAEGAEDVAAHPDRGRDQDEETGQLVELVIHEAEGESC